jgi:cation transport regulator ChaB
MPYDNNSQLPNYVKKYEEKVQSQWRHVFNTVFEKTKSEKRAMMAANSVLKKRADKYESLSNHDKFQTQIDNYLGNLRG